MRTGRTAVLNTATERDSRPSKKHRSAAPQLALTTRGRISPLPHAEGVPPGRGSEQPNGDGGEVARVIPFEGRKWPNAQQGETRTQNDSNAEHKGHRDHCAKPPLMAEAPCVRKYYGSQHEKESDLDHAAASAE